MKRHALVALVAVLTLIGACFSPVCDCAGPGIGLVVWTAAPITQVALSGSACDGGQFRCRQPVAPENTIPPDCTDVWVVPKATGECIVDLTVGGTNLRLEHRMREYPACCGGNGTFIGDEDQIGFLDLRYTSDAGESVGKTKALEASSGTDSEGRFQPKPAQRPAGRDLRARRASTIPTAPVSSQGIPNLGSPPEIEHPGDDSGGCASSAHSTAGRQYHRLLRQSRAGSSAPRRQTREATGATALNLLNICTPPGVYPNYAGFAAAAAALTAEKPAIGNIHAVVRVGGRPAETQGSG